MTTTSGVADAGECYCCGGTFPESELARLWCHPEVALCGGCAGWLATRGNAMTRAVPVLNNDDLRAAEAFWTAAGFDVEVLGGNFAVAMRDGVEFHLVEASESPRERGAAYLHVADVDSVHASWAAAGLPVSDVRDQPWGMREFHVVDPGGNRVRVGRGI